MKSQSLTPKIIFLTAICTAHITIANDLTTSPKFELIDSFTTFTGISDLPGPLTIGNHPFYIDSKNKMDSMTLLFLTKPVLNMAPTPRYYGEEQHPYYVKTEQGFRTINLSETAPGTLLYVQLPESQPKLAGYVTKGYTTQNINNQEINSLIIRQALGVLSIPIHITELPPEITLHTLRFLPPEAIYNFLFTNKQLQPIAREALLKELQVQEPLKVTPGILTQLVPEAEYITRIKLTNGVPSNEKPVSENNITDDVLKELDKFFNLQELVLRVNSDDNITDAGLLGLDKDLRILSLKGRFIATDTLFQEIASKYKKLNTIKIPRNPRNPTLVNKITTPGIQAIISGCPALTFLSLPCCPNITNGDVQYIADNRPTLLGLDFSENTNITDDSIIHLVNICEQIRHLGLVRLRITDSSLNAIAVHCPQLQYLDLEYPHPQEHGSLLQDILGTTNAVNFTNGSIANLITQCTQLQHLGLSDLNINNQTVTAIANHCPQLKYLELGGNHLVSNNNITDLVAHCRKLEYLGLSEIFTISDETLKAIASNCPELKSLILYGCRAITPEGIKNLSGLNRLKTLIVSQGHKTYTIKGRSNVKKFLENPE